PSRQSWSNAIGSSPFLISSSFTTSSISRNDMSGLTSRAWYVTIRPSLFASFCRHTCNVRFIFSVFSFQFSVGQQALLVGAHAGFHLGEFERLLDERGLLAGGGVLPGGDVLELRVVPLRLAVLVLELLAEVAATRLAPSQCVDRQQLRELDEVDHPA